MYKTSQNSRGRCTFVNFVEKQFYKIYSPSYNTVYLARSLQSLVPYFTPAIKMIE
jgi:hypothetical protein